MSKMIKCPATECREGVFTYKWGWRAGQMHTCMRCGGKGVIDIEAERAEAKRQKPRKDAIAKLRVECERQEGRSNSSLYQKVYRSIATLEFYEPHRALKLWDSVHAGRVQECVAALVAYYDEDPERYFRMIGV